LAAEWVAFCGVAANGPRMEDKEILFAVLAGIALLMFLTGFVLVLA
jgi:hypothetical protein